jgi:hypothetical protein
MKSKHYVLFGSVKLLVVIAALAVVQAKFVSHCVVRGWVHEREDHREDHETVERAVADDGHTARVRVCVCVCVCVCERASE